jgi:hypothetical protein
LGNLFLSAHSHFLQSDEPLNTPSLALWIKVFQTSSTCSIKLIENRQAQIKPKDHLIEQQLSEFKTYSIEIAYLQKRLNILLSKRYRAQSKQLKYI